MQALDKLMFTIGVIDQATRPVANIDRHLTSLSSNARDGFIAAGVGAAGLVGSAVMLKQTLGPALEMEAALGEVKSLEVSDQALQTLTKTALQYSVKYGESAAGFVSASYDIQSAISGLNGTELSSFTNASGVLAKATKADTGTITNYMGTMYGIFKNQANQMGKSDWVDMVAGRTAAAVQMFKTNGNEMSAAFTSVGANATSAGIDIAEQMAILGTLQATMSGSEAGTKYKSFIAGVGTAQDKLGMSFTDSQGRMLPMLDILDKLQGKFGDTLDVAESDALKKAFGSDEAVSLIKLLMADTNGLAQSMDDLGNVTGLSKAEQMAAAIVDPFERWSAGIEAVQIGIGSALLPVLNPLVDELANGLGEITAWTQMFPNLTRYIGYGVLAVIGLTAASAAFTLGMGLARTSAVGFRLAMLLMKGSLIPFGPLLSAARMGLMVMRFEMMAGTAAIPAMRAAMMAMGSQLWINITAWKVSRFAMWAWSGTMALGRAAALAMALQFSVLRTSMMTSTAATWLFNAALWASPVTWVVAGVIALIAAVGAVIYWWDDLKAAFGDTAVFQGLMVIMDWVMAGWQMLSQAFLSSPLFGFIATAIGGVVDWFMSLGGMVGWVLEKLNSLPGVDIEVGSFNMPEIPDIPPIPAQIETEMVPSQSGRPLGAPVAARLPQGGISQQISTAVSNRGGNTYNVGIHAENAPKASELDEWMEMQGA